MGMRGICSSLRRPHDRSLNGLTAILLERDKRPDTRCRPAQERRVPSLTSEWQIPEKAAASGSV